jgi:hypothetical protein
MSSVTRWSASQWVLRMPASESFLYVRARHANRTYVGATFCPHEKDARHAYECISEGSQFDFSQLRREAQQTGQIPEAGVARLAIANDEARVFLRCLATIAAGNCQALPRQG